MQPLSFRPLLKRIRWGGQRLGTILGKAIGPEDDYAESWEICDHGEDQSYVLSGRYQGWTLNELVQQQREKLLGSSSNHSQFPLLIKFLDCHDRLSVQVHPNDLQAKQYDPQENGKTEAWIVMQADPGSLIYAGFREGVCLADVEHALEQGTLEQLLHRIEPKPGDCFYIPAGTVHALGEGVLIAEVQQSSDLTFRLHDWDRLDRNGQSRPLHIQESLQCLNFLQGPVQPVKPRLLQRSESIQVDLLVDCDYFTIKRYRLTGPTELSTAPGCRILMGLSSDGLWQTGDNPHTLREGQTLLIPASSPALSLQPQNTFPWELLLVEIPES